MNSARACVRCGAELSFAGLWGLCTKCLYGESIAEKQGGDAVFSERRFGDYHLVQSLGRGGMGIVYEAIQVSLSRPVALKMIVDPDGASPTTLRRFTLEAEVTARLDHPNIVPIYEVGEEQGQPFLSMKLISGRTLRNKIAEGEFCLVFRNGAPRRGELRERALKIVQLMATVARAVHHAHEHGVIHRDLKPGNILIDAGGQPHLTDFGVAKVLQESHSEITGAGGTPGTPSYMSPEQIRGQRLTPASDIYSLGAILYEMLTGLPPFKGSTALETLRLVVDQQPSSPRALNHRVDRDLETICLKSLEKDPVARYRSAEAMAQDLERWLRQEPIQARPAGLPLRTGRWIKRNRLAAALITSLCFGLILALLLLGQALDRQRKLDLRRANSIQRVSADVEEIWNDPEKRSVLVSSSMLADLADLPPRQVDLLNTRLAFGLAINDEPFGQAMQYAPFLHALENRLEKTVGKPVIIDLRLYKFEADALRDSSRGSLQIYKMGAIAYVFAKRSASGLTPLARELTHKSAVIFASNASRVTNLTQLVGRRLAFGQPASSATFWAKVHLMRAGIRAVDLASCIHLSGAKNAPTDDGVDAKKGADRDPSLQSHKRVIQEVLLGHADAGVASRHQFELARYRKKGLIELKTFDTPAELFVACPDLDPALVQALRETLPSFRLPEDKEVIGRLVDNAPIHGFEAVDDAAYDEIRAALEKEVEEFERGWTDPSNRKSP